MHVLLIGGGGREHALAWRIAKSSMVDGLAVTHSNPGFPHDAIPVEGDPVAYAQSAGVGLVVVGPEAPLAEGLVDRLIAAGIPAFGPTQAAARLESSKAFAKSFMDRHGIPTAGWSVHDDSDSAHAAVTGPCVVKADGLAAGKGVIVAHDPADAHRAIDEAFSGRFGAAGERVVIEELMIGPECSFLALCDGSRAVPLLPCRDHKRRFEEGTGPNTGGMGAICPPPDVDDALLERIQREVLQPTVDGMAAEGHPFRGVLYAGLMLTAEGPRVLEFNVRFGDPECQPLMVMLKEDLVPVMLAAARGELDSRHLSWHSGASCCVVMVAGAYPGNVPKGMTIRGLPQEKEDLVVFFAGARQEADEIVANGGRVLGVTARGANLDEARQKAYAAVEAIHFETAAWRKDIGSPGIHG